MDSHARAAKDRAPVTSTDERTSLLDRMPGSAADRYSATQRDGGIVEVLSDSAVLRMSRR
jgi:hypothetical protein